MGFWIGIVLIIIKESKKMLQFVINVLAAEDLVLDIKKLVKI